MSKLLKYKYHIDNTLPENIKEYIFVFGSNLGGFHGRGAALEAKNTFGAEYKIGIGLTGRSYAIPTKDRFIRTLELIEIKKYVDMFKEFSNEHPKMNFWITAVGTGLAGYKHHHIAPLFKGCNINCVFPEEWKRYLED